MSLEVIDKLDLENKESLVLLMFAVQLGDVSCRRAATEILEKMRKRTHES